MKTSTYTYSSFCRRWVSIARLTNVIPFAEFSRVVFSCIMIFSPLFVHNWKLVLTERTTNLLLLLHWSKQCLSKLTISIMYYNHTHISYNYTKLSSSQEFSLVTWFGKMGRVNWSRELVSKSETKNIISELFETILLYWTKKMNLETRLNYNIFNYCIAFNLDGRNVIKQMNCHQCDSLKANGARYKSFLSYFTAVSWQ